MALWKSTPKTLILDANAILRYLLKDIPQQASIVEKLVVEDNILVLPEVLAEVIYVLTKVYGYAKINVANEILSFLKTIKCDSRLLLNATLLYSQRNLSFVDCILYQYAMQSRYEVFTFDEKLNKIMYPK
jgi:predicted nucleic acid-binding protein